MTPPGDASPPALRLLLACGRAPSGGDDGLGRAASAVADWPAALDLAAAHGLLPLLARRLEGRRAGVPAAAAERLRRAAIAAAAKGQLHLREAARLAARFAAHGVAALPWKGALLAEQAHGDPGLRDPGDVDLLVARAGARRACALLAEEGFRPVLPLSPREERAALANQPALTFAHEGRGLTVDLAWGFFRPWIPHRFSPGILVDAARPGTVAGVELPVPPPEELLAALCLHAARHRWERLVWPCDVAGFARRRPGLDWDRLLLLAHRGGVLRALLAGLAVADALFGAGLPGTVRAAVAADRGASLLARSATDAAEAPGTRRGRAVAGIRHQMRVLDRPADRLRLLARWATATNESDWAWASLPAPLFPLYPLLRPVRILVQNLPFRRSR